MIEVELVALDAPEHVSGATPPAPVELVDEQLVEVERVEDAHARDSAVPSAA